MLCARETQPLPSRVRLSPPKSLGQKRQNYKCDIEDHRTGSRSESVGRNAFGLARHKRRYSRGRARFVNGAAISMSVREGDFC
jgi:hypothetical protein